MSIRLRAALTCCPSPPAWAAAPLAALLFLSPSIQAQNICQRLGTLSDDGKSCFLMRGTIKDSDSLRKGDFQRLNNVETLYMYGNSKLTSLPEGVFQGLNNLQTLWLNLNNLSNLPKGVLQGLSNLQLLDLNANGLTRLPEGIFQDLNNLQWLNLNRNKLTCLPSLPDSLEKLHVNPEGNIDAPIHPNDHNLPPCKPFDETELSLAVPHINLPPAKPTAVMPISTITVLAATPSIPPWRWASHPSRQPFPLCRGHFP